MTAETSRWAPRVLNVVRGLLFVQAAILTVVSLFLLVLGVVGPFGHAEGSGLALLLLPLGLAVGAVVAGLVTCAVLLPVGKPARVVVLFLEAVLASNYSGWNFGLWYWPSTLTVLVLLVIPAAVFLLLVPNIQERGAPTRWGREGRIVLPRIEDWEAPTRRADEDGTSVPEVEEQEAPTRRRRGGAAVRPLLGVQSLLLIVPAVAALALGDIHGGVSVIAIVVGVALAVLALAPAGRVWAPPAGRSGRYAVLTLEALVLLAYVSAGLPGPGAFVALAMPAVVVLALVIAALLWNAPDVSGRR